MTAKGTYVPLTPQKRWGNALAASMRKHGISERDLAAKSGVAEVTLAAWRKGYALANLNTGMDVAQALGDIPLENLLRELRTRECETCGASFVTIKAPDAKFCSRQRCRYWARQRDKINARDREQRADVQRHATASLVVLQKAVNAFCWDCEPEGVCRMSECKLRKHSPLPLADERLRIA